MHLGKAPTKRSDVLIVCTSANFRICVIGLVERDGQQDFRNQSGLRHARGNEAAIQVARELLSPPHRIFLLDLDGGWRLVADSEATS